MFSTTPSSRMPASRAAPMVRPTDAPDSSEGIVTATAPVRVGIRPPRSTPPSAPGGGGGGGGGEVDEQHIQLTPQHVAQEFAQRSHLERAAPDETFLGRPPPFEGLPLRQQELGGHHLDAVHAHRRADSVVPDAQGSAGLEEAGHGGAPEIRVEHAAAASPLPHH